MDTSKGSERNGKISLSETLQELRAELRTAMDASLDDDLKFTLGDVELEISLSVARNLGGSGKVAFWVVNAEASTAATRENIQRLKLTLKPEYRGGTLQISKPGELKPRPR